MDRSTILLVDDNPQILAILSDLLRPLDYRIFCAINGSEALELAAANQPDLVLLDVMMPGMDGFSVCQALRADPRLAKVPVIMITALDDRASRLRGFEVGADDFIGKPFDYVELRARVSTVLRLNRYRLLLEEQERTAVEKARFAWVVEQSDDGYLIITEDDRIQYSNQRARELLSIIDDEPGTFLGHVARQYSLAPQQAWASWPQPLPAGAPRMLVRPETATAAEFWLQVDLATHPPSGDDRHVVRLRDVTAQITSQRDMWTFHAMVAHKMRTPLASILGGLNLISDSNTSMDRAGMARIAGVAIAGARRLQGEIDDILNYLRPPADLYGSDQITLDDIDAMVAEIASDLQIAHVETIRDSTDDHRRITVARHSLDVTLRELLKNARKFHPDHDPLVHVTITPATEGQITLRIADDGTSLSPEQIASAWRPYYQGERSFTGQVEGMGLGLALVARIVYAAGGRCAIANRGDGPGVVVEITLPLASQ
ncbi:response regulator [Oscillochloris sp. ZM17-4]|uniref:response regulator n=1 Tax=Oscillochloris sp. ZM17-4 TaxID=2866714 RepID=UPI001C72A6C6|nr:response regulator [Oscillochloris sp. ZM17-4]MBX0326161.1 response regulator [Oscillochloris sp. ZM17-4]